jgi:hypothetical protein
MAKLASRAAPFCLLHVCGRGDFDWFAVQLIAPKIGRSGVAD